jgi:hypothetical protein
MNVGYSEEARQILAREIIRGLIEGVREKAYAVARELVERADMSDFKDSDFLQASIHVTWRVRDLRRLLDKLDAALAYQVEWTVEEAEAGAKP